MQQGMSTFVGYVIVFMNTCSIAIDYIAKTPDGTPFPTFDIDG